MSSVIATCVWEGINIKYLPYYLLIFCHLRSWHYTCHVSSFLPVSDKKWQIGGHKGIYYVSLVCSTKIDWIFVNPLYYQGSMFLSWILWIFLNVSTLFLLGWHLQIISYNYFIYYYLSYFYWKDELFSFLGL